MEYAYNGVENDENDEDDEEVLPAIVPPISPVSDILETSKLRKRGRARTPQGSRGISSAYAPAPAPAPAAPPTPLRGPWSDPDPELTGPFSKYQTDFRQRNPAARFENESVSEEMAECSLRGYCGNVSLLAQEETGNVEFGVEDGFVVARYLRVGRRRWSVCWFLMLWLVGLALFCAFAWFNHAEYMKILA
jgi:hypothetical protein